MTNTTTLFPTISPINSNKSNKDSNLGEMVFYGVMGGVVVIFVLTGINEVYGPFLGVERSDPVLPEGVEPSTSWSLMGVVRSIFDIKDGYDMQTGGVELSNIALFGVVDEGDQVV